MTITNDDQHVDQGEHSVELGELVDAELYELPDVVRDALINVGTRDSDLAVVLAHLLVDVNRVGRLAETLIPVVDQVGQFAAKVQTEGLAAVLPAGGLMGLLGNNNANR